MKKNIIITVALLVGVILLVVGIILLYVNTNLGSVFALIGFITIIIAVIIYGKDKYERDKAEAMEKWLEDKENLKNDTLEYFNWLKTQNFECSDKIGGTEFFISGEEYGIDETFGVRHVDGFIIDIPNEKWGKIGLYKIFDFSDIVGVDIAKHRKSTSTTESFSNRNSSSHRRSSSHSIFGVRIGGGGYSGSGSSHRSEQRVSQDQSTYDVLIKTSDIENALITIPCGLSNGDAETIKATIKSIIANRAK